VSRSVKLLILALVVLAVLVLVIDLGARVAVERISARELRDAEQIDAAGVETSIDSFPFLGRLLLSGETSFSIVLEDVTEQGGRVDRIEFDVDGLVFDRGEALDRRVRIDSLDRVRATAVVEEDTISGSTGVAVDLEPGSATVAGVSVGIAVDGRVVRVSAPGLGPASFAVPSTDYLPCDPDLAIGRDRVELSCTTDTLPPLVNQVLGRANP
jgi:hypothetical protein